MNVFHRVVVKLQYVLIMKALKFRTLGASFGKPCASGYFEGILDDSIVRMYIYTCL